MRVTPALIAVSLAFFAFVIGPAAANGQTVEKAYDATLAAYNKTLNQMEECDLKFEEFQQLAKKERPVYYASREDWERWQKNYLFSVVLFRLCMDKLKREADNLRKKLAKLEEGLDGGGPNARTPSKDPKSRPRSNEEEAKRAKLQRALIEALEKRLVELEADAKRAMEEMELRIKAEKASKPGFKVETTSTGVLSTTTLTTPQGRILVHLPADMRPGDTISGTANFEPNGQTEAARTKNLAALNGYQLKIANEIVPSPWSQFTFNDTRGLVGLNNSGGGRETTAFGATLEMEFLYPIGVGGDQKGKGERHNIQAPVEWGFQWAIGESKPDQVPPPPAPPLVAQNGRPAKVTGSFDGKLRTTLITIGGQPATMLAESPRSCIFKSPEQNLGLTEIIVKENNVETKGTYRNLGVRLSAPKTNLMKGEKTTVTIEVSGLEGIQKDVPLKLESTGVINMEGGNSQNVRIRPSEVKSGGIYTTTRGITGQQTGGFNVTATVIHGPIIIPLVENASTNGFRVKKDGSSFIVNVENVKHPITGDPVDGQHKLEHKCPDLKKLPYIQTLFLDKGLGRGKSECLTMITPHIIVSDEN